MFIGTVQGRGGTIRNGIDDSLDWSRGELTFIIVGHVAREREKLENLTTLRQSRRIWKTS